MFDGAIERVVKGVGEFQTNVYPAKKELFHSLADKQEPKVLFLTCADSRIDPSLLTQSQPGQLFICRNIGNIVPPHGTPDGSVATIMEYAIDVLKIEHIIICGHSSCGAMKSLLDPTDDTIVPRVTAWLRYAESARRVAEAFHGEDGEKHLLRKVSEQNVITQLTNLRTYPEVAVRLEGGNLTLHGWYYDITEGVVNAYNEETKEFVPLAEWAAAARRA
jgi:carbonic anhydrase